MVKSLGAVHQRHPFQSLKNFSVMNELFALGLSLLGNLFSKGLNSAMSRGDFNYTHRMTNIPAQVNEMREAGLNPALAYGQISPAQGQVLGQYQSDLFRDIQSMANSREARANAAYREAETDVLKAQAAYIIQKTKAEAGMATFDWAHQGDRYNLEIEGKGLVNAGQRIQNQGYQLDNRSKFLQNEILGIQKDIVEFDRQMKSIDAEKHRDYVEAELKRIVSGIFLTISEANSLRQKLPKELEVLNETVNKLKAETDESKKNTYHTELENQVKEYLIKTGGLHGAAVFNTTWNNSIGNILWNILRLLK